MQVRFTIWRRSIQHITLNRNSEFLTWFQSANTIFKKSFIFTTILFHIISTLHNEHRFVNIQILRIQYSRIIHYAIYVGYSSRGFSIVATIRLILRSRSKTIS